MRRLSTLCLAARVVLATGCDAPPSKATGPETFTVALSKGQGGGHNAQTHLTGDEEVPARETPAQGQAQFKINAAGTEVEFKVQVANIDNVIMSHIHLGAAGTNGPIVVWLTPGPPQSFPNGGGPFQGRLAEGTFTAANLTGPLAGQPLSALIDAMRAGNTYVNVHTNDGVAPTNTGPGDFPGGEVRGQLVKGNLFND